MASNESGKSYYKLCQMKAVFTTSNQSIGKKMDLMSIQAESEPRNFKHNKGQKLKLMTSQVQSNPSHVMI